MRRTSSNRQSGFTLLELSFVMIVMGILAAAVIPMVTASYQKYMREQDRQILETAKNAIVGYAGSAWGLPCLNSAGGDVAIDCDVKVTLERLGVRATDSRNQTLAYYPSWMLTKRATDAAVTAAGVSATNSKTFFCTTDNTQGVTYYYQPNYITSYVSSTFGTTVSWSSTTSVLSTLSISDPDTFLFSGTAGATNGLSVRAVPSVCLDRNWDTKVRTSKSSCYKASTNPSLTSGEAARQAFVLIAKGDDQTLNLDNGDTTSYIRVFENPSRPPDLDMSSATGYYDDIVVGISPAEFKNKVCQQ